MGAGKKEMTFYQAAGEYSGPKILETIWEEELSNRVLLLLLLLPSSDQPDLLDDDDDDDELFNYFKRTTLTFLQRFPCKEMEKWWCLNF